jgi:hypothetical protein
VTSTLKDEHFWLLPFAGQVARLLHAMTSDGRIDAAGCPTLDDFRRRWMADPEGGADSAAAAPAAGGRHREARKPGKFQYGAHPLLPTSSSHTVQL